MAGRARRLAVGTTLLAGVLGCATVAGSAPGASRPPLDAADARLWARLLQMSDARRLDVPLVESALASSNGSLRAAAALAVGQVHGAPLAPGLRALLSDRDSAVAANAAFALGLLRDSASVPALAAALPLDAPVSREAAWALGEIGAPARGALLAALGAGPAPRPAARALPPLLVAAGRLRPAPAEILRSYATRPSADAGTVRAAAYAIARARLPAGVRTLLSLAGVADGETREQVARGLAKSAAGDSLADTALVALDSLARDPRPHVRVNALRSLGGYGARARRSLLAATSDGDPNVRVAAAQSLANVLPATRRDWQAAWRADTAFMYRRSLLASAVATGVILEAIDEDNPDDWQRYTDWRYRAAVAEAAADAPQIERIVEVALPMTRDHDGRVRAAAYGVFAPWVDSSGTERHPWRRRFLLPALRDPDVVVRATALGALAGKARATEVPAVLASYALAASDSLNDARLAAARYLAAAWRLDSASFSDSLRRAIAALPAPADPLVVAEGKGSSLLAGWRADTLPLHDLAWYEQVVLDYVAPSLAGRGLAADLVTERGVVTLGFLGADAPLTVRNFLTLARDGYYSGTRFHRVVPNFVAQDGDPRGDGNGGPGYAIRDELNRRPYERGTVGMALSGPDTGGSQYFLTLSRQPHLDGHYTVFARVLSGDDVLDRIVQGDAILEVRVR